MNKAIMLDRDGTINVDYGYLHDPKLLEFMPGAIEALQALTKAGYKLIIITNQSGIGRGYFTGDQYSAFHNALLAALKDNGVEITATYMCPHSPEESCLCRKPLPYMVLKAIKEYNIDAKLSYMLGDKSSDVKCGEAAGLTSRRITDEHNLLYWANEIIEKRI